MSTIALLCTDFDGTLVHRLNDQCTERLAEVLTSHRDKGGEWVISTGRTLWHTMEGLERFQAPISPDYIVTEERTIHYLRGKSEWQDLEGNWNSLCKKQHEELLGQCQAKLRAVCQTLSNRQELTLIEEQGILVGLMASSEEIMDQVAAEVAEIYKDVADLSHQRNTIYLRFCHVDYHKGSALAELCRLTGIQRETVFAAGDNFNDISMLDGTYAAMCACPANAIAPVKKAVFQANGFIASQDHALGVREAIEYFWGLE